MSCATSPCPSGWSTPRCAPSTTSGPAPSWSGAGPPEGEHAKWPGPYHDPGHQSAAAKRLHHAHAAHTTHATHAGTGGSRGRGRIPLLGLVSDNGFGGEQKPGNRGGILQGRASHLGRVDDPGF